MGVAFFSFSSDPHPPPSTLGVDFVSNVACPNIDFATVHVYPDNWMVEAWEESGGKKWIEDNVMVSERGLGDAHRCRRLSRSCSHFPLPLQPPPQADRARLAFSYNKPIIMEEVRLWLRVKGESGSVKGCCACQLTRLPAPPPPPPPPSPQYGMWQGYGLSRNQMMDQLQNAANSLGFGATLVWAVYAWPVAANPKQYNFMFGEDGSVALEKQWAAANGGSISGAPGVSAALAAPAATATATSAKCTDTVPPGGYTCAQQKGFNKCGADWMVSGGFCSRTCGRCQPAKRADGSEILEDGDGGDSVSVQSAMSAPASG